MRRAVRLLDVSVAVVALLLASGCDPSFVVEGRVMLPDGGPVDGALVKLRSPGSAMFSVVDTEVSHDGGAFRLVGVGCVPKGSEVALASSSDASNWAPITCRSTDFMCGSKNCTEATAVLVANVSDALNSPSMRPDPALAGINEGDAGVADAAISSADAGVLSARADDLKRVAKLPPCHGPHYGYFTDAGMMAGTETGPDGKTRECRSNAQ